MWYFTWVLGTGFAACFGIINAMWYDAKAERGCGSSCKNECKTKK